MWRMHYLEHKNFADIEAKVGIGATSLYSMYQILQKYLHDEIGKNKFKTYLDATAQIRAILKNEVETPKPAMNVAPDRIIINEKAEEAPYTRLGHAMQDLERAVEGVIAYNVAVEREKILKIMTDAKYDNWAENLRKKFAGEITPGEKGGE